MTRWAAENDYDALVQASADSFGDRVPVEVIKAVIATESAFKPGAMPPTTQADVSAGLMQLTLSTARGLGYPGDLAGLFDPGTNIFLGTKLLDQLRERLGEDWDAVYSAYNGGIRPEYGFGVRATQEVTVCLVRNKDGSCARTYTAEPGEFGNQPNVDRFHSALAYFQRNQPSPGLPSEPETPPDDTGPAPNTPLVVLLLAVLGGLLFLRGK